MGQLHRTLHTLHPFQLQLILCEAKLLTARLDRYTMVSAYAQSGKLFEMNCLPIGRKIPESENTCSTKRKMFHKCPSIPTSRTVQQRGSLPNLSNSTTVNQPQTVSDSNWLHRVNPASALHSTYPVEVTEARTMDPMSQLTDDASHNSNSTGPIKPPFLTGRFSNQRALFSTNRHAHQALPQRNPLSTPLRHSPSHRFSSMTTRSRQKIVTAQSLSSVSLSSTHTPYHNENGGQRSWTNQAPKTPLQGSLPVKVQMRRETMPSNTMQRISATLARSVSRNSGAFSFSRPQAAVASDLESNDSSTSTCMATLKESSEKIIKEHIKAIEDRAARLHETLIKKCEEKEKEIDALTANVHAVMPTLQQKVNSIISSFMEGPFVLNMVKSLFKRVGFQAATTPPLAAQSYDTILLPTDTECSIRRSRRLVPNRTPQSSSSKHPNKRCREPAQAKVSGVMEPCLSQPHKRHRKDQISHSCPIHESSDILTTSAELTPTQQTSLSDNLSTNHSDPEESHRMEPGKRITSETHETSLPAAIEAQSLIAVGRKKRSKRCAKKILCAPKFSTAVSPEASPICLHKTVKQGARRGAKQKGNLVKICTPSRETIPITHVARGPITPRSGISRKENGIRPRKKSKAKMSHPMVEDSFDFSF